MKNEFFKGTPWPWIKGDGAVYAKGGSDIAAVFDGVSDDVLKMDMEVVKANVNLIAAAPELLEALDRLVDLIDSEGEGLECGMPTPRQWYDARNKAEAAIDKALGNE